MFHGKRLGYLPNASKTSMIVKEEFYDMAIKVFAGTYISITLEGKRHLEQL